MGRTEIGQWASSTLTEIGERVFDPITENGLLVFGLAEVQYLYPDGDILSGGWETAPTPGQTLADQIDEDPPVDTDYIFEEV